MASFRSRYGAHPVHLVLVLACLALAAYASMMLFADRTVHVGGWFVGSAIAHDAVLLPAYALLDVAVVSLWRRSPGPKGAPWINHVRIPAAISLVLLLMFAPEITRRNTALHTDSRLSTQPYLVHWLDVVAALTALSLLWYLVRLGRVRRRSR
jgi:hypothetical protein